MRVCVGVGIHVRVSAGARVRVSIRVGVSVSAGMRMRVRVWICVCVRVSAGALFGSSREQSKEGRKARACFDSLSRSLPSTTPSAAWRVGVYVCVLRRVYVCMSTSEFVRGEGFRHCAHDTAHMTHDTAHMTPRT